MTATAPTLRARIFALFRPSNPTPAARRMRLVELAVLAVGLLAVIVLSVDQIEREARHLLRGIIWSVTLIFLVEYLVRLWVAPELPFYEQESPSRARLHWALSVSGG